MSQRFLKIKNFKNIGITKEEEQWERLYLNNSLDKDKIGELIILIGENNVGKSNILDAINIISLAKKYRNENFKNCLPYFSGYNDCLPKLKLVYIDDDNNSCDLELNIDEDGNAELISNIAKDKKIIQPKLKLTLDKVMIEFESKFLHFKDKELKRFVQLDILKYNDKFNIIKESYANIINSEKNINTKYEKLKELYLELKEFFNDFVDYYNKIFFIRKKNKLPFIDLDTIAYTKEKEVETYKDIIKEKYDIDFIPNIFFYKEEHIKDEEFITTPEKIKGSKFFNSLFKAINYRTSIIATAYEKAEINPKYQEEYQKDINEQLKNIVSKRFNELYFQALGTQEYSFEITLKKDEIYLSMKKNGSMITLAQQSVGFKWFFNFFFNFLYTDELKAGDIVLMDEPEIHLSIPGRRDLRKFIKKFAKDTGITFIATTHNPSFVDIDYLDEVRIIKNDNEVKGAAKIESKFFALADNEVDTLDSIINSFGILRSDLTKKYKIIFVEGITDYNYLTAFKFLYNQDKKEEDKKLKLVFLPIGGLGKGNNEKKNKLIKLSKLKISEYAVVLVDSDASGEDFHELCIKENLTNKVKVDILKQKEGLDIELSEDDNLIDEKKHSKIVNEIENLFSPEDIKKYLDILKSKSSKKTSLFKKMIFEEEDKPSKETIDNFNKLLEYLKAL